MQNEIGREKYDALKVIVYRLIRDHNSAENCLTQHLLRDLNMHLHFRLGWFKTVNEATFRRVLNRLKDDGCIDHLGSNQDTWVPKPANTSSLSAAYR